MSDRRSPFDIPHADECPDCRGKGYTPTTAQLIRQTSQGPATVQQGSGCSNCLGVGRLVDE